MQTLEEKKTINLVADLGEGYGNWQAGDDARLMDVVSSANVACGFHAGDPLILDQAVAMCAEKGVDVYAHPGFDDKRNFGRVRIEVPQDQLYSDVMYQLGAITAFTEKHGIELSGVNPHGGLSRACGREEYFAEPVFRAIHDFNPAIRVGGQGAAGVLGRIATEAGHPVSRNGYPDRNLEPDGSLVARTHPEALVKDADTCVERAITMIKTGSVLAVDGVSQAPVEFDTLLLHGDKPEALETAEKLRDALEAEGITIKGLDA